MSNSMGGEPAISQRAGREDMSLTFVTKEDISPRIPVFAGMMDDGRFGPSKAPTDVSWTGPELVCHPYQGEDGRVNAICGILSRDDVNAPLAAALAGLHDYGTEGGEWMGKGVGLGFRSRSGAAGGQALRFDMEAGLACVADVRLDDRETLCTALGVPQPDRAALADGDLILRRRLAVKEYDEMLTDERAPACQPRRRRRCRLHPRIPGTSGHARLLRLCPPGCLREWRTREPAPVAPLRPFDPSTFRQAQGAVRSGTSSPLSLRYVERIETSKRTPRSPRPSHLRLFNLSLLRTFDMVRPLGRLKAPQA